MDPKLFSQQGMNNSSNQPNPNMMMQFQQQQQQQQHQQQQQQQQADFNSLVGAGLPFNGLNFGQNDFGSINQDLSNINPFIQPNPSLMGMNVAQLHQQALRQNPQSIYSPQNLMAIQGSNAAGFPGQFQNRGMYQVNGNSMPNTPQALMFQQQQQQLQAQQQAQQQQQQKQPQSQQAAMAMNRVVNSPSQSPALNNAHFPNNNIGSPNMSHSSRVSVGRLGSDYAASPMNPNVGSPVQNFQQGNGISPSPQMARSIPSQMNNRYMQQMNAPIQQQQQFMGSASPSLNNPSGYASPHEATLNEVQTPKSYNTNMSGFVQQSPMQTHGSPVPRQSVTPGSAHSTPRQPYQQLDNVAGTPHMSPTHEQSNKAPHPMMTMGAGISTSPSPKPFENMSPGIEFTPQQIPSTISPMQQIPYTQTRPQAQPNPPETPKQQITYIPKTRNVDTYGGVDLKYFDKFEIKEPMPHMNELGLVDIQALIMSLKSGMKMEVTNALNILTILSAASPTQSNHHHHHQQQQQQQQQQAQQQQPMSTLPLTYCDDLLDVLLDYLEQDILGTCSRFNQDKEIEEKENEKRELTYKDLFDMSLDEMKSLIPELEDSTSDVWLSLRERCLCIFNILRNLSFMMDNVEFLARHRRFIELMILIIDETGHVKTEDGVDTFGNDPWFIGIRRMDRLDFRKSILIILSNISIFLNLPKSTGTILVEFLHDFIVHGPDTYYSFLAIETWTKLTVNYENRNILHLLVSNEKVFCLLEEIWLELTSVIQRDFFSSDGRVMHAMTANQLAILELTIIGLYNIVAIVQKERLKQYLIQRNKSLGMMIIRLSITLAESGNAQFGLVTKRGMELIRSILCGGDGIRKKQNQSQSKPLQRLSQYKQDRQEEKDQLSTSDIGHLILDMSVVREKLMLSTLKPTTDPEILRELFDIVSFIDEDSTV